MRKKTLIFTLLLIMAFPMLSMAEGAPFSGLPQMTIRVGDLDQSGDLIYAGIDIALLEETNAQEGDTDDTNGDGKVFRVKEGKVKRILTNHTSITIDFGGAGEYKKAVRYKLAVRTLYTPAGVGSGGIIIAGQSNGRDGWAVVPGSEFILSYFAAAAEEESVIKHTTKWEENRIAYNKSKVDAGIIPEMTAMRPENTFWSGEKLLVEIKVTEPPSPAGIMRVSLCDERTGALVTESLDMTSYEKDPDTISGAIYRGEIWNEGMFNKWGNHEPRKLVVKTEAIAGGEAVETKYDVIVMDNKDLFYRIKRAY